jgi:site-specific recombinase XerD
MARNISGLALVQIGAVRSSPTIPGGAEVVDAAGETVEPISDYLRNLSANGCSPQTCRSYSLDLLRWWRFLATVEVSWERATRDEFIDFVLWMRAARPRRGGGTSATPGYAPRTINHACAVVSGFYAYHLRRGAGPMENPAADARLRQHANHNPMRPFVHSSRLPGRQKIPRSAPKAIPDNAIDQLFAQLHHHRDRALIAMFLSTGARASELLTVTGDGVDFGNSRVEVVRKGSGDRQWLPASPDAFVWLRLYLGPRRLAPGEPLWLTLREPTRPLNYFACRKVFLRAQEELGTVYTLHQLRHTAAYRMVQDPSVLLTDVQWVLGHSALTSTQIYTQARPDDVLSRMAEFHRQPRPEPAALVATGYSEASLETLFGSGR